MNNRSRDYFEVNLAKADFKFNAAHFVAFENFRERLHGHNYRVSVKLIGSRIRGDGYLIDFGDVKKVTRKICKDINERVLIPTLSDVIDYIYKEDGSLELMCRVDNSKFVFPQDDCAFLPLKHSTAEELCVYLWGQIVSGLGASFLRGRGITTMEITVAEDLAQEALFRYDIPADNSNDDPISLNVCDFITSDPKPCLPVEELKDKSRMRKPSLQTQLSQIINEMKADQNGCKCCKSSLCLLSEKLEVIARQMSEVG